ncbi:hypothetical protein WR25_07957 [Diploscapter pachys]|uniref:Ig-like domain-containing protein n=1 Tax=Diploscapter pachys TaxID=2018661 RepID=A0A2A2KKK6_9BILA|nr:hypothetical protein WR25_07957 [Diploscapter pachys]
MLNFDPHLAPPTFGVQLLEPVELRFVNSSEPVIAKAGETIELQCKAFGVPPPIFFWLKDGKRVGGSGETTIYEKLRNVGKGTLQSGITVSTLRIPCIDASKAATYTCIAINGYKKIQKTIKVEVEGNAVECPIEEKPAPYVTEYTESRFENIGNSAQLMCRHTDKEASVIWFNRDMEKINNNEAYEILPNGDLMIRNADFDRDTGVFTCVVANESGESRAETFFYAAAPDDEEEAKRKRR